MERKVELGYALPKESIDRLLENITALRNARTHLCSFFKDAVSCDIHIEFESRAVAVTLREISPETLEGALHVFMNVGGFPNYFTHDSDLACCDRVLASYKKKTKPHAGFAIGKYVATIVDAQEKA